MSIYIVGQLKFIDEPSYRAYHSRFAAVFDQFEGQLLSADAHPLVLEGNWSGDKIILMAFENRVKAEAFLHSPEYAEISKDRKAGAETLALLVQGL